MTERKFTSPTEFPAEYVDGNGKKAVILGRGSKKALPFIGYDADGDATSWTATGMFYAGGTRGHDLHDIPKRITTCHNVYEAWIGPQCRTRSDADESAYSARLCVYRIERDEDGGNHEMFKEEV